MKNKRINTIIFILAATLLNILILGALATLLTVLFLLIYKNMEELSVGLSWLAVSVILGGSIVGTFLIYSRIIRWFSSKWNMEDIMAPLIPGKKRP